MTNYNIAVDALEEAAKFRLFEKAAAAENINLADMSETDVEDLYSAYNKTHEVNTMNDQLIDLFEKQAAYEGVDLDSLSDDELAYVYNNFLENLAEEEEEEDYGYDDGDYYDEEAEAYEKLAEAEILGRHMARAYVDELEKTAADANPNQKRITQNNMAHYSGKLKELLTGHQAATERANKKIREQGLGVSAKDLERIRAERAEMKSSAAGSGARVHLSNDMRKLVRRKQLAEDIHRAERLKGYGKRGLIAGGVGAVGYGAKKMMEKEAANDAIYSLAFDRAQEFVDYGIEDYDGSTIDNLAIEVLQDNGYSI